jgi:hypothetical protein
MFASASSHLSLASVQCLLRCFFKKKCWARGMPAFAGAHRVGQEASYTNNFFLVIETLDRL